MSGQVAQAEAAQQAALYNYRLSIQNAFADVDNSLVANQKLVEQQAAQERLVNALKSYAQLATLQFNGGYTSYTTVLQAEQSLFPAQLQLASLRASVFSSSVEHLQGDGRRLGRRRRRHDRRPRAARCRARHRDAAPVLTTAARRPRRRDKPAQVEIVTPPPEGAAAT